jgi:hypothetical protein
MYEERCTSQQNINPKIHISPHCAMVTSCVGLSRSVRVFSIIRTMSIPSITLPKTTCLLFRKGVAVVVIKNWQPFVFGPEFYNKKSQRFQSFFLFFFPFPFSNGPKTLGLNLLPYLANPVGRA